MSTIQEPLGRAGLIRVYEGRVVAGVCAGIGRGIGLGPWVTRLLFLLANLVIPGSFLIVYIALWILMPIESAVWRPAPPVRR